MFGERDGRGRGKQKKAAQGAAFGLAVSEARGSGRGGLLLLRLLLLLLLGLGCLAHHFGSISGSPDGGGSDEDRSSFHDQGTGFYVADHFCAGADLDAVRYGDVAFHAALDDDGAAFYFGFDFGGLTDGERSVGTDLSVDLTVNDKVILKADFSLDFNIFT